MGRLKNPEELSALRESLRARRDEGRIRVRICTTGCRAYGAMQICQAFEEEIGKRRLQGKMEIVRTGCHGFCARAPVIAIDPQGLFYQQLTPADVPEIVDATLEGRVVERLAFLDPVSGRRIFRVEEVPFYQGQMKVVLRNCGQIDPTEITHYFERDGYAALSRVLAEMTPQEVIEAVKASGLRGRGGVGFPTGLKWKFVSEAPGDTKYIVCNAEEGEPSTFKDLALLEGDPHSVLEGMIIAAYAIAAEKGYIYLQSEYSGAIRCFKRAVEQAEAFGILGENILGSDFSFSIDAVVSAGGYVCGEETALLEAIEGKRAMPRPRPPFPAQSGLWGCPTNINNVETYANVPLILLKGAEWFCSLGTERSKGTKILCLAGEVKNAGLIEVPMGTPLRKVIFDIGGGTPEGKNFKAVMTGGPSGGFVSEAHLDLRLDYEGLASIGNMMGSGSLVVLDGDTCMVEIARFFMDFLQRESCGKCVPCRIGTKRMLEILARITEGRGRREDIGLLIEMGEAMKDASLCGLGQAAPNPILSAIAHFRREYEEHIEKKYCAAGICRMTEGGEEKDVGSAVVYR